MTQGLGISLKRPASGSNMPTMKWLHYAGHKLDPICQSVTPSPAQNRHVYDGALIARHLDRLCGILA